MGGDDALGETGCSACEAVAEGGFGGDFGVGAGQLLGDYVADWEELYAVGGEVFGEDGV